MKKYLFAAAGFLLPVSVLANGGDEDASFGHQMEEVMPFEHFAHGHILGGTVDIILWAALIYVLYVLVSRLTSGKKNSGSPEK